MWYHRPVVGSPGGVLAEQADLTALHGFDAATVERIPSLGFRARGVGEVNGRTATITVIQRFGGAPNIHFHSLAPDGVFVRQPDGTLGFILITETCCGLQDSGVVKTSTIAAAVLGIHMFGRPMQISSSKNSRFGSLKHDLPAAIVVFLVALPLCLGIALASDAPLLSGVIAGVIGGTLVAAISASSLGVSGPAAGLVAIVIAGVAELGSYPAFLAAVVMAGVIQVAFGLFKAGVISHYFPSSVIKGMLSGIGIIIILKQIPHAAGYHKDPEGDWAFFQVDGHNTFSELKHMIEAIHPGAALISLLSLAILVLWRTGLVQRFRFANIIQGPLIVVAWGIVAVNLFQSTGIALHPDQLVKIPVAGSVSGFFDQFMFPDFSIVTRNSQVFMIALTIAVVASLESLLCLEATDKLDPRKPDTPTNRELIAQGVGNIASGAIGGLPVTQVIVRSSANVQSGGKTKLSAILHGLLLLVAVTAIPGLLNSIPLSCLAAILIMVGFKLATPSIVREMYNRGWSEFVPYATTVLGIVLSDMLIGISLGMAVAIVQLLWNNFKVPYHFDPETYREGEPIRIELSEDVSFLNKASIRRTLTLIPEGASLVIDGTKARNIHPDIIEIIDDFKEQTERLSIDLTTIAIHGGKDYNPVSDFAKHVSEKHSDTIHDAS